MARKGGDQRSGQDRRRAPRSGAAVNRRTIKRDDDTSQLLKRGEGSIAEEQDGGGLGRVQRRPDEGLAAEIREILTNDPELDATEIEVEVEGGAVTISGLVDAPDARLLAEELVESVTGVREVHNQLRVER